MFCKTCGRLLQLKTTSYGKWMACPEGHAQPELVQSAPEIKTKNLYEGKEIKVDDGTNLLAMHDHKCPKCGFDKAELMEMAPNYSDEDGIYRMKCGKCGFVEQLDGKVK